MDEALRAMVERLRNHLRHGLLKLNRGNRVAAAYHLGAAEALRQALEELYGFDPCQDDSEISHLCCVAAETEGSPLDAN